jgi:nucleotide-binding universal stress UspA family protein
MAGRGPIVVGIDFSAGARAAVGWARELARQLAVPLSAVHVSERSDPGWHPEQLRWMAEVGVDPDALIVRRGVAWIELARFSETIDASFLVVGSHGRSGYQPVVPGSTTVLLLTRSHQPVVVVPDVSPDATTSSLAVRTDRTRRTPPRATPDSEGTPYPASEER